MTAKRSRICTGTRKHDLVDHYERALARAPPLQPIDYVGEALRASLGASSRGGSRAVEKLQRIDMRPWSLAMALAHGNTTSLLS